MKNEVDAGSVPSPSVLVLGAGAMGSLFGGLLAEAGVAVTLVDINAAHIDAICQRGLKLVTDHGARQVRLAACRPDEVRERPDLIILFTKAMHTESALAGIQRWIGPETRLLSLQNGLGNGERIAAYAASSRVAIGITTCPADLCGPGHVESHGQGKVRFTRLDGVSDEIFDRIALLMCDAGLDCAIDPMVHTAIWEKVAFNAALNSICAVTGCAVDAIGRLPAAQALALEIVDEVLAVAGAEGVAVDAERVRATLQYAIGHHVGHKPSMLQDVLAGRATEIESINGAVAAAAAAHGVATPNTLAMLALIRMVEDRVECS